MAWTAPRTWVTSEIVTSTVMNTHVRDNLNALRSLDSSGTDVEFNATTAADQSLYSFSVPGNTIGANGGLRLIAVGDYLRNTGTNQLDQLTVKYGGQNAFNGSGSIWNVASSGSRYYWRIECTILNKNATNSQLCEFLSVLDEGGSSLSSGTGLLNAHYTQSSLLTVDSTANQTLELLCSLSVADGTVAMRKRRAAIYLI